MRSAQLAATNSIEATPIRPATKKTTTSASARQMRSISLRDEVENDADLRMVAPPIGDGAADEGEDRQDKPGDFVGPEKGLVKDDARQNVGKHKKEFAKQRADDNRFGQPVERAQSKRLAAAPPTTASAFVIRPQPRAVATRRH